MAKLDYTKQGDIKYLLGFAVSLNFKQAMEITAFETNVSQNRINSPELLTDYLAELYERGEQRTIERIFSQVPIDFNSENGKSYTIDSSNPNAKPFGETLVGGIILSILYPDAMGGGNVTDPGNDNGNMSDTDKLSPIELAAWILGGVFVLVLVMWALYLVFTKVGK